MGDKLNKCLVLRCFGAMVKRISNPPNPWESATIEWVGEPPRAALEVYEERAKSALAHNKSPDLPFRWSLNPYRGCFHACAYCYARASHQHLGFGSGTDFDRRIVVKTNIAERLEEALERPSWIGESITLSGNTDCYQPLESSYRLTRACLEVLAAYRNPVVVITKGAMVRRDADLLAKLASYGAVRVFVSLAFVEAGQSRLLEPGTASPALRFETMKRLSDSGIPVGLALAPVIPGLNDSQIPELLSRARDAGADRAFMTPLRLSDSVRPVFEERLREVMPQRAGRILNALQDMRGGNMTESRFGHRMRGLGPRWEMISRLFDLQVRKLGMMRGERSVLDQTTPFRRPTAQLEFFEGDGTEGF
jgi:DNA repair photolyase